MSSGNTTYSDPIISTVEGVLHTWKGTGDPPSPGTALSEWEQSSDSNLVKPGFFLVFTIIYHPKFNNGQEKGILILGDPVIMETSLDTTALNGGKETISALNPYEQEQMGTEKTLPFRVKIR